MIQVVSRNDLDYHLKSHFTTLRMRQSFSQSFYTHGGNEGHVPVSKAAEDAQGECSRVGHVMLSPNVLIETLDDMMWLRHGLAKTKGKNHLAIGKVTEDLAHAP